MIGWLLTYYQAAAECCWGATPSIAMGCYYLFFVTTTTRLNSRSRYRPTSGKGWGTIAKFGKPS